MFSLVLFSSSSSWGQLVCGHVFFFPFESLDSHDVKNFGIRIPPRQVTLYQTVCIWLLHFFLLGGNSIASKSPRTNSDLPSSRQHEENTEDKTEAGVKNPQTLCFTLWLYYSRQWSSINCDLYKKPVRIRTFRSPCGATKNGWNSVAVLYDLGL